VRPGERVTVIREAAETLAAQEWSEIDLTPGQFGFPAYEEWEGDKYSYTISKLQQGTEDALAELHAYLKPAAEPPTQPTVVEQPHAPWTTGGFRLFVSHVAAQKQNAAFLKAALAEHSIEAFIAHEAIEPGEEWVNVIEAALQSCDALAAWLTPPFRQSDWCDQEVGFAVGRGILVIPMRFRLDPYGFIGRYQAMTIKPEQKFHEIARSLFELVLRHERSRFAMARALVWQFEQSRSFDAVRSNFAHLRVIPPEAWTGALKEQARTAHERNYEIKNAWIGSRDAPDVVAELIAALP